MSDVFFVLLLLFIAFMAVSFKIFLVLCLFYLIAAVTRGAPKEEGTAAYYSGLLDGEPTASGELYCRQGFTAASYTHFKQHLKVTNKANSKSVQVWCNDRGPAVRLARIVDLSEAAFAEIATSDDIARGTMQVTVEVLP